MATVRFVGAAGMLLLLAACAGNGGVTMHGGGGPKPRELVIEDYVSILTPGYCEANVYVLDDTDILVDQEPVRNKKCPKSRIITFKVIGPYKFGGIGIEVKPTSLPMPVCTQVNVKKIECAFAAAASQPQGDRYPYTIHLLRNDGTPVGSLDPMMINF